MVQKDPTVKKCLTDKERKMEEGEGAHGSLDVLKSYQGTVCHQKGGVAGDKRPRLQRQLPIGYTLEPVLNSDLKCDEVTITSYE